jgi:hypothetical protein
LGLCQAAQVALGIVSQAAGPPELLLTCRADLVARLTPYASPVALMVVAALDGNPCDTGEGVPLLAFDLPPSMPQGGAARGAALSPVSSAPLKRC